MNPLLSLSFAGSGPVTAGAEPAVHDAGTAIDNTGGVNKFGRLLNQSGEQQAADRQSIAAKSIAGFTITGKGKRAASMEGQPTDRPEYSVPPVIPPEAELILADEKHAGTLLGLLDLASQTRLKLTSWAEEKGEGAAKADSNGIADSADSTNSANGKKVAKGEWFILPVYPGSSAAGAAAGYTVEPEQAEGDTKNQSAEDKAAAALLAGINNAAGEAREQSGSAPEDSAAASLKHSQHNTVSAMTAAEQAVADAAEVDAIAASANTATEALSDKAAAHTSSDKLTDPSEVGSRVSALNQQSKTSANVEAELLARQQSVLEELDIDSELTSELKALASAESAAVKSTVARQTADPMISAAEATELQKATARTQSAATTIFENADKTVLATDDNKPGSTLASAAMAAESSLAKQLRGGSAESHNQTKQSLLAESETGSQQTKADSGFVAGSARTDSSLSGFGSIISQTAQSQGETLMARLEAATVTGSQQTAERAKAQSVNQSVTEQLKQVNLLAQNAAGQLKERINMMVRQNIHVAEIRLDPADLGQMQIRVNLQQEQASVQFIVQQQHAKELLEQQMPRLREMLQQQGIQLGEGNVQQQRHGDSQASGRRDGNSGSGQGANEQLTEEQATAMQLDVKLSERIVDYYA